MKGEGRVVGFFLCKLGFLLGQGEELRDFWLFKGLGSSLGSIACWREGKGGGRRKEGREVPSGRERKVGEKDF